MVWLVYRLGQLACRRQQHRALLFNAEGDRFPSAVARTIMPGKRGNEHRFVSD